MTPIPVQPHEVDTWLPEIEWHLNSFCRNGHDTPERLVADVKATQRQLWLVVGDGVECAMLTSVAADALKTCDITHCAGRNARGWLHLFELVERWARDIGCKNIRATARPGWERLLAAHELKKTHVVLEKRLQ